MTPKSVAFILSCCLALPAQGQEAAKLARDASRQLEAATAALSETASARDRIAALTKTVRAYENGLSAMREGLRRAALEERSLRARLDTEDARLAELLTILVTVERTPEAISLLHPAGPLESIRAGMIVAELTPALQARAQSLAGELETLSMLVALQSAGIDTLEAGLEDIRTARLQLSQAMSDRTDLPAPIATDDAAIEALINSSETLAAFADSLAGTPDTALPRLATPWPMPINGQVLRRFNEADAAGVRRPGWVIATEPQAVAIAPVPATVRFSGDLPGQGKVVILEPAAAQLVILTGLGETFAVRGQIVSEGDAIGLMGGKSDPTQEKLIETFAAGGQPRSETLYMELRQVQKPVDPAIYFAPGME